MNALKMALPITGFPFLTLALNLFVGEDISICKPVLSHQNSLLFFFSISLFVFLLGGVIAWYTSQLPSPN